ncbi:MAG TPA: hydantoinase B/oxoprolinase family protein [Chloroflexota bacterium]|nr:hydantoinase B/oxoprolinase family protein [Chloroflexota bacterium]
MAVSAAPKLDPVTLEVVRNALPAITNEMSVDLQRTSYNMMIYEVRDYCCALLDVEGRLLSQNMGGVSHFVADLGVVIKDGVARYGADGFKPGDVIITNHERVAGQHLNNIVIYTPIFFEGELWAFAVVRAHWVDVGGMSTGFGGSSGVTDPWMEGLQLDQVKIYEGGKPDHKALKIIRDNIRFPESSMGDLRSQLAACALAERRVVELLERYGRATIEASIETIFAQSEAKCRAVVAQIKDGEYEAEAIFDHDWVERDKPVPIKVKVIVKGDEMTIDLTECSPQRRGAINSRTLAAPYIAYKALTGPLEPVNEGSFAGLRVIIQEGNIMMARYPATMAAWSLPLPTVVDTIVTALAPALPERAPAAHLGTLGGAIVFFGTNPDTGKGFVLQSIEGGGWGGRPWEDGESTTVSVCQGDVRNAPIENMELKVPVLIESRALRVDSAGPGKYRGGFGIATRVRNLVEGRWNLPGPHGRGQMPPWGLWGGKSGTPATSMLRQAGEEDFHENEGQRLLVPAGSQAVILTAGGGGWGNPLERDPAAVQMDVLDGLVSLQSAREDYGVVLDARTLAVDEAATAALRRERAQA